MRFYSYLEFVILLALVLRLIIYTNINNKALNFNLEIILYIIFMFLNNISYLIFGFNKTSNSIFDAIFPLCIIVPNIGRKFNFNILITLILFVFSFLTTIIFMEEFLYYFLSLGSLIILILTSIKLAQGSSINLKKTPLYLILIIDFLFMIIIQRLIAVKINWSESHFIGYVENVVLFVYLINLILSHVYVRRFFIN